VADVHVVPQSGEWGLKVDNSIRSTAARTRRSARGASLPSKNTANWSPTPLGEIREKDSHGNDPRDIPA
jgi:hypothetical protein